MPRKTKKVEPKFEEEVIPEEATAYADWNTTASIDVVDEASNILTVEPAAPQFVAFAAFDLDGKHYEAGDPFTPPANLRRDVEHETLRGTAKRRHTDPGLSFAKDDRRLILPVKEM